MLLRGPDDGRVLHTINVRLSPEQILYTIDHAEDDVILLHEDFLPLIEQIRGRFERPPRLVLHERGRGGVRAHTGIEPAASRCPDAGGDDYDFPVLDERTRATTFYTTGTTGNPKGVWVHAPPARVATPLGALGALASGGDHARLHRDDVYMPITPMFHVHGWGMPFVATLLGVKQVYPGRYEPEKLLRLIEREGVTFSHWRADDPAHAAQRPPRRRDRPERLEGGHRGLGDVRGARARRAGPRHRRLRGIRDVGNRPGAHPRPARTPRPLAADDAQIALRCKAGRPVPLVDLRVVDESMQPLAQDGVEHRARSCSAPRGRRPDTSRTATGRRRYGAGATLHTGDIGCLDGEGYLQITDRLKDVIKSGGEWISSIGIEDIVSALRRGGRGRRHRHSGRAMG